jgi:uncharacterized membrane protein
MIINWKNPITISIITYIVVFISSFIALYFIKPKYIMKKHNKKINYYLLIIYSLLYGNLASIIIFMCNCSTSSVSSSVPSTLENIPLITSQAPYSIK